MRGEQFFSSSACARSIGSPPLARGTAGHAAAIQRLVGITPACAGNRRTGRGARLRPWDHPRLRGEQFSCGHTATIELGSPPLARGTAAYLVSIISSAGITPACAGNSQSSRYSAHKAGDHPRLRGEQEYAGREKPVAEGSPPLARGTVGYTQMFPLADGITPACAGNSKAG